MSLRRDDGPNACPFKRPLDAQSELYTHINLTGHLDDLGELDRLLGSALEVLDGEDLETRLVDLDDVSG